MNKNGFGSLVKEWRGKRKMSQAELSHHAGISTKHLSFLETGRASPSRDMVEFLTDALDIPLRERNDFFRRAGFASSYESRDLNDPSMWAARETIQKIINSHEPFPALAVDRHWNLLVANQSAMNLMKSVHPELLTSPINVLRLSLHPKGLAKNIINFGQWRDHLLKRLDIEFLRTQDQTLKALRDELAAYPEPQSAARTAKEEHYHEIAIPIKLRMDGKELSFISTTTVFGSPNDITLSEIALETFFPADEETLRYQVR